MYQPVLTHINLNQLESTRINPNQPKSTQNNLNQLESTRISPYLFAAYGGSSLFVEVVRHKAVLVAATICLPLCTIFAKNQKFSEQCQQQWVNYYL